MSKHEMLRALVNERLSVAAEEIYALFERTIAEYEEELRRSKEENQKKQQFLNNPWPRVQLLRVEEVQNPSLSPPDHTQTHGITEIFRTKEEPEEHGVKQEEEQLLVSLPESSACYMKREESPVLQQRQIEHREETQGEEISSERHNIELSWDTDNDEEWDPPFGCSDTQLGSWTTAQSSGLSSWRQISLEPRAAVNNRGMSETDEGAERKHQCSNCQKRFKTKQHLHVHTRVHTGEKPYSCAVCEKTFAHKGSLVIHRRIHTGEKPYICSFCNNSYGHKGYLQKHMRTHTGERPYSCTICGKFFSQKSNLEVHKRTHTGEKPYSCSICNSTFAQKTHRDAHMRMCALQTAE